ncbi:class I glutamine amidotransferase-like protein [Cercophora newfieldiana]|uniref:Class I glutamine amidotransferase-like protein n=1 Tax=Cercophora newfieldiana TaxID=92897 RepID=A0AA40D261_9PEZI|nr:class I glutamine amidotransferase-like protein [Cercophora newfieldiana]
MAGSPVPRKTVRIGVMMDNVQLMDVMGIDLFGNLSREYLDMVKSEAPPELAPLLDGFDHHQVDMEFLYLAPTLEPTPVTVGLSYVPNMTYDDCPRDLDIILVGGPLLSHRPPQADKFMKEAWTKTRVWLTTCTGSVWLASTGLLDGKKCTTNRGFLATAKRIHPEIEWLDQRWVIEDKPYDGTDGKGELWTAGAAGAGLEMIAHYCLQNWDPTFVSTVSLYGVDMHPEGSRGQFYSP